MSNEMYKKMYALGRQMNFLYIIYIQRSISDAFQTCCVSSSTKSCAFFSRSSNSLTPSSCVSPGPTLPPGRSLAPTPTPGTDAPARSSFPPLPITSWPALSATLATAGSTLRSPRPACRSCRDRRRDRPTRGSTDSGRGPSLPFSAARARDARAPSWPLRSGP